MKHQRQKKLNNIKGDFNGVEDITEAESVVIPKDSSGTKVIEEEYKTIFDYEILDNLVNEHKQDFVDDMKTKIGNKNFNRIESGLKDFTKSASSKSLNLQLLKASILKAYGENFVTTNYESSGEDVKQLYPKNYFESMESLLEIDESWLIKEKHILKYAEKAKKHSEKILLKFSEKTDLFDFDASYIYRGYGNPQYYKQNISEDKLDFLSVFSFLDEPMPFFERQILSSYSLNFRIAEKFMILKNNERKALVKMDLEKSIGNVFSSFIVSDAFVQNQYELLCLPNSNSLNIIQNRVDEYTSEFTID